MEVNKINDWQEKMKSAENGAFFVWTYCGSLRGLETLKVFLIYSRQQIINPEMAKHMTMSGNNKTLTYITLHMEGRSKASYQ